jgi:branched-chain amino acid transport system ATP-binding protein
MLELRNVHTYYGETHVLHGISLKVAERSVSALFGRNGMGKSTIIYSIMGVTPPRQGSIFFRGEDLAGLNPNRIAQMGIGLVPQGRRIFPSLTVKENLTMAERNTDKVDAWDLNRVYSLFPILEKRANMKANLLSGGEQQMLAISRALMTNPTLLLMDEPSEGLSPGIIKEIINIIGRLKETGLSILLVEQNISMALAVADYTYVVNKGVIVHESTPEELDNNDAVKNVYIGVS